MNKEREKAILEIAIREKTVNVKRLARELYASEPSIRRDLNSLEQRHLLKRIHGGAVLDENALSEIKIPFLIREFEKNDEKVRIARKASEKVFDGSVIFLDASTSAYNVIPFLREKRNITVITNGVRAIERLSELNINCIGTGGHVINSCMAFVGEHACRTVKQYNADICFFSCRGLSGDGLLTDISEKEDAVRYAMICRAREAYMLCTSDKRDKKFYHNLCTVEDVKGIIYADEK